MPFQADTDGRVEGLPPGTHPAASGLRLPVFALPRRWLLGAAALIAVTLVLGVTVSLPGLGTAELGIDQDFSRHHDAVLSAVALALNLVFEPVTGLLLILVVAVAVWVARRSPAHAAMFAGVACSGWVASEVFKLIFDRPRPDAALLADPLLPETGLSFPSGHTAFTVALAFAVWFLADGTRWGRPVLAVGLATAVVVAWSRIYLGVHYPTDVLGSFPAAGAAVLLAKGVWNWLARAVSRRWAPADHAPLERLPG